MNQPEHLAYQIGYNTALELSEWDLYETPERAYEYAKRSYNFVEGDYQHFKAGVLSYFTFLKTRLIE
jgi:hypothetical protein